MINIGSLIRQRAYLSPDVEGFVDDQRLTFRQMNEQVNRVAHSMGAVGLQTGDRIAFLCKNHRAFVTGFFAASKCGIISIPVNWRLQTQEIRYILEDSETSVLIYDAEFADKVEPLKQLPHLKRFIQVGEGASGDPSFDTWLKDSPSEEPELRTSDDDPILLMYTSGTTGKPKGAILTHQNLLFASIGISHVIDWWFGDRFLSVAPFFHIGGFAPLLTNVHNGSTTVLMADFEPAAVWKTVEREKITTMMTVPAMLAAMGQTYPQVESDISTLRNITCGASSVSKSLIEAFDRLGISVQQVYGITEFSGAVSFWKKQMNAEKSASMGKAVFHGEAKVVDIQSKAELAPGQIGEILCKGPQVFKGYWNRPEETAGVLREGWYHTGDLGMIDEDGFLYVVDRLKDMIISGGENIYSAELEAVLQQHPAVADVAVVGVPHETWGEIPRAYVVTRPGQSLTSEELIQLCQQELASYKCVKDVVFVDALPRNAVGKVLKARLKQKAVETS